MGWEMSVIVDQALRGDAASFDTVRKLGALSLVLDGEDAVNSVVASDKALFTISEAVAVAEGQTSEQDVVENLIDRAAVHMTVWAQQKCVELCETSGAAVGAFIGGIFGKGGAVIGEKVGRFVGHGVGRALKPVVEKGVQIIASVAKGIWSGLKSVGKEIVSGIKAIVNWW